MLPPGNQRKNYVQFVNAHQPVHPADESQQEQVQGRKEQLTGDNLRMAGDYHRFINESGNAVVGGRDDIAAFDLREPKKAEFANAMHPVGRIGKVEEIASAVLYLCSDGAAFTTGHSLAVDGGVTAF